MVTTWMSMIETKTRGTKGSANIRLSYNDVLESIKRNLMVSSGQGYNFYRSNLRTNMYIEAEKKFGKKKVEEELSRARALFRKYDENRSGYLERDEILKMMKDSYRVLKKAFNPTDEELDEYLRLLDSKGNNMVSLDEYEVYVLRSLHNRSLHI